MTCIVGYKEKGGTLYMGADSAGAVGSTSIARRDRKVFKTDGLIFGFTSSFRMGQLLQFGLEIPKYEGKGAYVWMVKSFVPAVRKCLKDGGYMRKENNVETGGCFLVGAHGRLFQMDSDFQVAEYRERYAAIGCGEELARGTLFAIEKLRPDISTRAKIRCSLLAAEKFSGWVKCPFRIVAHKGM